MRFSNSNMFNMQTSNRYIVCVKLNLYAFFVWETRMRGNPLQWADQADGKICKYYCIMHTCSFNPELQSSNANINVVFGLYSNTLAIMWFVFIPSKPYFGVLNGNWYIRYSILGWMVSKGRRIKTMSCVFFFLWKKKCDTFDCLCLVANLAVTFLNLQQQQQCKKQSILQADTRCQPIFIPLIPCYSFFLVALVWLCSVFSSLSVVLCIFDRLQCSAFPSKNANCT